MNPWIYSLPTHQIIKQSLLNIIDATQGEEILDEQSHIHKTDYFQQSQLDYFSVFHAHAQDFYQQLRLTYCVLEFDITNTWYQQYHLNDTHSWHFHSYSNISFVYYIELNDARDSTQFYDVSNKQIYQMNAVEGDIVIFPSSLLHRSPQLMYSKRKTVISGNINLDTVDINLMK